MLCALVSAGLREAEGLTRSGKAEPSIVVVVVTGLLLVFAILVLLYLILTIEGKIFTAIGKKKQKDSKPGVSAAQPVAPSAPPAAPEIGKGVPPEVVAAIAAAISASSGGAYTLRSVTAKKEGRGRWGLAGVLQSTEPF